MHYLWWIPSTVLFYVVYYWISVQNNHHGGKWFWILYAMTALCPLWLIVSRVSKRLLFDGMLYDAIIVLTFPLVLLQLGEHGVFGVRHWLGLFSVVAGLIVLRT